MFAAIREASGTRRALIPGPTVADVLEAATAQFGERFEQLLPYCSVMVDESPAEPSVAVNETSEVALLPPVSGG